eukprot:scaffold1884_cov343-Ochromonas_danica.AAC.42
MDSRPAKVKSVSWRRNRSHQDKRATATVNTDNKDKDNDNTTQYNKPTYSMMNEDERERSYHINSLVTKWSLEYTK